MHPTCKDCIWWESFDDYFAEQWEVVWGTQFDSRKEAIDWLDKVGYEWQKRRYGMCRLAESDGDTPEYPQTTAIAIDGEQYYATLKTAPHHHCSQVKVQGDSIS